MDTKTQLMNEKDKLLKQISESAMRGDSQEVLAASEKLHKVESLIGRYERIIKDISNLDMPIREQIPDKENPICSKQTKHNSFRLDTAGRGIGREIRLSFLKRASENGICLEHIRGSIYKTESGDKVGIAVATERKPDRWFLGLPAMSFNHAVLLCNRDKENTIEIIVPQDFFEEYGERLSQSGGQMKFNVARRGSGYSMLVPGTDGISVSKYIGAFSLLDKRAT